MLDRLLPYLAGICILALIVIRVIRARKSGAAAVKFEVLYLIVYGFLAGVLVSFFLNHPEFGLAGLVIFGAFLAGFILRALPLFRLISEVERKAADKH